MIKVIINAPANVHPVSYSFEQVPHGYSPLMQLMRNLGFKETHLPIADFLRQAYGLPGQWILCEPVYWEAGHNDAMLVADARMLEFSEALSLPLFRAVAEFLAEEGIALHYHTPDMWLIRVDDAPKLNSLPIHMMLNHSFISVIKELDMSSYWQRLMTELQMFLKSYAEGLLPVNGFWFSGYEPFSFTKIPTIFTNDELLLKAFKPHFQELSCEQKVKWDKNTILFVNPYSAHLEKDIQEKIGKDKSSWIWNDVMYTSKATHWWNW